jgi:uncharacterized membrane protein YeiH
MACVMGGIAYWGCMLMNMDAIQCQIICGVVVFLARTLSVKYNICLPVLKGE